jgi:uncharacterized protein YkwD
MRAAALLLTLPVALALGALLPSAPRFADADADPRPELLRRINAERQRAGSPPLRRSALLTRAAQDHADEIAARGSLKVRAGSTVQMHDRLARLGYLSHAWTESLASNSGSLEAVLRDWREHQPDTWRKLMARDSLDLGIGLGRLDGQPLYTFLFAVPEGEWFAGQTAVLRDLARVRAEMLVRVNAERKRAGLRPLAANPRLDQAAQRHAADMLARRYFAHQSPEGNTVRERARSAGYDWREIGENLAEGQLTVAEVMDSWMHSPGHRRNLLDPGFRELGVGLALGRGGTGDSGFQVEWVQAFGTRR